MVSLGHLSWLCLLPTSHLPPNSLTSVAVEKAEKALCKPCPTIKTSLHYQLCVKKKSKHIPIPDTGKKINSSSAKTSTEWFWEKNNTDSRVLERAYSGEATLLISVTAASVLVGRWISRHTCLVYKPATGKLQFSFNSLKISSCNPALMKGK